MGKLKLLLLLGLFFTISKSSAQIYDGHYLPFGLGYSHQTVKDNSFSPVSYSGHLGSISTGYYSQTKNWLSLLDISGFGAFLYPNVNRENNSNDGKDISDLQRMIIEISAAFQITVLILMAFSLLVLTLAPKKTLNFGIRILDSNILWPFHLLLMPCVQAILSLF